RNKGFGRLMPDPQNILNLPKGFSYKIISRQGEIMKDGFLLPGKPDGMATFQGKNGRTILIRNHELGPEMKDLGPFGKDSELLARVPDHLIYDAGHRTMPGQGGVSTLIYNTQTQEVESQHLSLIGTIRNCAGGPTPWNSWITCEETVAKKNNSLSQNHGYNFEVPAVEKPELIHPIPLKDMGRFQHEAVCVDPSSGIVYQTEDRYDGLIYRFLPNQPGKLDRGGKLQILAIKGRKSYDTRNWKELEDEPFRLHEKLEVEWLDIDGVDTEEDDLRQRGFELGAAKFARGEGMWYGDNELYFACTVGGEKKQGQIFRYFPSPYEGKEQEKDFPGVLELFAEPDNSNLLQNCDNLTIAPNGDLIVCEDREEARIIGITPKGKYYLLAETVKYRSEFAGATFSPDGSTLFVNIQHAGITLAINGPWNFHRS
ncbi:MAG: DUF839 domain-containing protein, partial [Bacteroidetes bacterium]|nr:DUF839 domain-containing protein [Bacteroidota bacterium]